MVCPREQQIQDGGDGDDLSRRDGVDEEVIEGIDRSVSSGTPSVVPGGERSRGLLQRLSDALNEGVDNDLLMERSEQERGMLQWLRALDLQVLGACRADERLKPLLKFNLSGGVVEDRLISHLSQHFEASELGTLARCLCVPLVSVRVGKVNKEGNLLCPTSTKGYLQLTLLPSSDMRLSFCGDDGASEKLILVSRLADDLEVKIEEISADKAGRSFLLRLPENRISYFWCSEKSKRLGFERLSKMKDLLQKRPTLSQLSGVSTFRLDAFANHIRAYLLKPSNVVDATSWAAASLLTETACSTKSGARNQPVPTNSVSARSRPSASKPCPSYPSSLGLRPNSFKDVFLRNSPIRSMGKVKLRCDGQNSFSHQADINVSVKVSTSYSSSAASEGEDDGGNKSKCIRSDHDSICLFPDASSLSCSSIPFTPLSFDAAPCQAPTSCSPSFSPCYCWCPPCTFNFQNTRKAPPLASESMLLPPLSALLSNVGSSLPFGITNPALNLSEIPALDLPSIFPLPSSIVAMPSTQQIPTFTPFMSDPIVHIPVIDVCSSGQGYLVSAGPAISTAVPPLCPTIASPLIPEAESEAEKNARETLRMLMASTPANPPLISVLPAVLTSVSEDLSCLDGMNRGALVSGSRGLYSGANDVITCPMGISSSAPAKDVEVDHILVSASLKGTREGNSQEARVVPFSEAAEEASSG